MEHNVQDGDGTDASASASAGAVDASVGVISEVDRPQKSKKDGRKSRSRSRGRSRDRDGYSRHDKRKKEKKRHKRRSKSSSRSSKGRSKSKSRSRSRSSESRSRPRSRPHRSRRYRSSSDDSDHDHRDSRCKPQYDSYKYQEPNNTIMVRGLATHLTDNDIRQELIKCGIMAKDIRLIRDRDTGASRGFAFVEFNSVADATRWIDMNQGLLRIHDQFQANLIYSISKFPKSERTKLDTDWFCGMCRGHNFKRREFCYKCNAPRPEQDVELELLGEITSHPTKTIILSNLDTLTTEENVLQAFQSRPNVACIPIKTVKIAREADTSMSRGFCYVKANNIYEASQLFAVIHQEGLEIDGRSVVAAFGKTSDPAAWLRNSRAAAAAVEAARWTNNDQNGSNSATATGGPPCTEVKTEADVEKMAQYCASLYATTPEEFASHLEYYKKYYMMEMAKGIPKDSATVNNFGHHTHLSQTNSNNAMVRVASGDKVDIQNGNNDKNKRKSRSVEKKQDKAKVAKKTAKEMEKWAKTLNQKKDTLTKPTHFGMDVSSFSCGSTASSSYSTASSQYLLEQGFVYTAATYQPTNFVDSIRQPHSCENDKVTWLKQSTFVNESKLACLLCQRKFSSIEMLQKHVNISELHKKNLEDLRK